MSDLFQIGSARFEFAAETVVAFEDGGMRFELRGQAQPFDAALHRPAFDPEGAANPRLGWVAPVLRSSTFHFYDDHDTPRRTVALPQHQPVHFDFSLWEEGFEFGLRLVGTVTLRDDQVELQGLLRHDYDDPGQGVPVHVRRAVVPGPVVLRTHTYGSVEEALAAPPERVRRLLVRQPWAADTPKLVAFPPEILRFTQLEFLSMQFMSPAHADFAQLPDAFCDLARLRELNLSRSGLRELPARFGALRGLESLSLRHGHLETLPDSIAGLAQLRRLDLDGNRLRTLPESVGHLPALQTLSIDGNPFASLPASLRNIPKVEVEKKNEALFRDIRYRPEIEVAIDREAFMARSSPAHTALLAAALGRHKLRRYEKALLRHARQALRLVTTEPEDHARPGRTRVGGAPDLPPDVEYPTTNGRLWHFYAQLELAALAPLQPWLPREGRLYFFGEGQEHGDAVKVLHSTAPDHLLRTHAWPADAEFVDGDNVPEPYAGYQVQVDATVSVPSLHDARGRFGARDTALVNLAHNDALQDAYSALETSLTGNEDRRRGAHVVAGHVFTQHESPQEQASRERGGLPEEWVNLLTLASDGNPGFCFWDAGTLTFTIHEKDLALGDFSRVHWSLESS